MLSKTAENGNDARELLLGEHKTEKRCNILDGNGLTRGTTDGIITHNSLHGHIFASFSPQCGSRAKKGRMKRCRS
jgi:hypothetical protein